MHFCLFYLYWQKSRTRCPATWSQSWSCTGNLLGGAGSSPAGVGYIFAIFAISALFALFYTAMSCPQSITKLQSIHQPIPHTENQVWARYNDRKSRGSILKTTSFVELEIGFAKPSRLSSFMVVDVSFFCNRPPQQRSSNTSSRIMTVVFFTGSCVGRIEARPNQRSQSNWRIMQHKALERPTVQRTRAWPDVTLTNERSLSVSLTNMIPLCQP